MTIIEIAKSSIPCLAKAETGEAISQVWFKSKPVDRSFCYRAAQLQLLTDSKDQGCTQADLLNPGCWSWFEIVILPDGTTDTPRKKDGKDLVWRSHGNRSDPEDTASSLNRCYGKVFDRREEILDILEIGNVIAVRVCARYPGWINDAREGHLYAKILSEDIFSPMSWTLFSAETPEIPEKIENGVYTLISTTETHVRANGSDMATSIWFTTPVLDDFIVDKIEDIQLFTFAHHQERVDGGVEDKWSWFDLVILASPEATIPKSKDGRSLVWRSHNVAADLEETYMEQQGQLFTSKDEVLKLLEPGDVIGVRVCAQFSKWETHAHSGRLVVRVSNKGPRRPPSPSTNDWGSIRRENTELQKQLKSYLQSQNGMQHTTTSIESELLGKELRADLKYGAGDRPLKLLSLGHHVRVAGDPNAKPCEYFDMIAGTSTGGLIAIMLGRLRMTIDQCIKAYERLSTQIFGASMARKVEDVIHTGARYSASALENAVKEIVKQYTGDEEALMRDTSESPCKVFVVATRADDISNRIATHLRTYTNPNVEKSFSDYKIWEAARATSAAPTYFPRIKLGDFEYVDGGLGFNNPVLLLMGEARVYYGFARRLGCLVTLGTGMSPNVSLPPEGNNVFEHIKDSAGVMKSMWELATVSEQANHMAELLVRSGYYYRFNVGVRVAEKRWVEKVNPSLFERWFGDQAPKEVDQYTPEDWANVTIDLDDYKGMGTFVELTKEYLKGEGPRLTECASKLQSERTA
ncbi:hypothetical protein D9756_004637 [Leucocoprinus leucothites]|uniref:PNPLA domain-containing protein n=1 Tax=Leucocoprinus leucothites TaxID=201217 RepID=A0A8H5LKG8_9AGAR|nr:hypothetical protein D9756_004637 [Leucoagaricus leucothites]